MAEEAPKEEENTEETVLTPEEEVKAFTSTDELKKSREDLAAQVKGLQAKKGSGGIEDALTVKGLMSRIEAHDAAYRVLLEASKVEVPDLGDIEEKVEAGFRKANKEPEVVEETEEPAAPEVDEKAEESPVEAPAEAPVEETPSDSAPAEPTDSEKVPVAAGLSAARIVESEASQPFKLENRNGTSITSLEGIQASLRETAAMGQGKQNWIGSFNPYGQFDEADHLTNDSYANFKLIHGEDTREVRRSFMSASGSAPADKDRPAFSAALNCAGPIKPVMDIPFCYSGGRPLQDAGFISLFPGYEHGQIQLYDCHELPVFPDLIQPAATCEDEKGEVAGCDSCGEYSCAGYKCIEPGEIYTPEAFMQCMCLPEHLQFAHPMVMERAMEDFAIATDKSWELKWLADLRAQSLIRTVDGSAAAEHGGFSTILRAFLALKSRFALDGRCAGGLQDYGMFVPGGEAMFCAAMADKLSRVLGCECPGEDVLEYITSKFNIPVTFGLDQDPNGAQVAEGFTSVWDDTTPNVPAPLESIVDAGTMYLIPRDTFITASPMSYEMGFEQKTKCEMGSGCMKMLRREWWFPLIKMGCRESIAIDFKALGTCGTGPDLTACS